MNYLIIKEFKQHLMFTGTSLREHYSNVLVIPDFNGGANILKLTKNTKISLAAITEDIITYEANTCNYKFDLFLGNSDPSSFQPL